MTSPLRQHSSNMPEQPLTLNSFLPKIALLTAENSIAGPIASRSQELWLAEFMDDLAAVVGCDANGYVWACNVAITVTSTVPVANQTERNKSVLR